MLTAREAREFFIYCARYPIDDEANHQFPSAQLATLYMNTHKTQGTPPFAITQFMPFHPDNAEDNDVDIEELLMKGNW